MASCSRIVQLSNGGWSESDEWRKPYCNYLVRTLTDNTGWLISEMMRDGGDGRLFVSFQKEISELKSCKVIRRQNLLKNLTSMGTVKVFSCRSGIVLSWWDLGIWGYYTPLNTSEWRVNFIKKLKTDKNYHKQILRSFLVWYLFYRSTISLLLYLLTIFLTLTFHILHFQQSKLIFVEFFIVVNWNVYSVFGFSFSNRSPCVSPSIYKYLYSWGNPKDVIKTKPYSYNWVINVWQMEYAKKIGQYSE